MTAELTAFISAIGVIITTTLSIWTKYNQNTHDKKTDYTLERFRKEEERRVKTRAHNAVHVYSKLWYALYELNADRVFVVQPHPLGRNVYVSVEFEALRNGVTSVKSYLTNLELSSTPFFAKELASRDFIFYKDVQTECKDAKVRSLFSSYGTVSAYIRRLGDEQYSWVGSLFIGFQHVSEDVNYSRVKEILNNIADSIQYILPPVEAGEDLQNL